MGRSYVIILIALALAGCTTSHGLKPISPEISSETASLRPIFKWEASSNPTAKYDFAIFDIIEKRSAQVGLAHVLKVPGETVYYRQGLEKNEHVLEADLKAGKEYLWSVRVRDGQKVERWSTYDSSVFYGVGYSNRKNQFFLFKVLEK
jgi:hypothetical protein